jgi:EAL domain-containing protein (putative c-di-GMP-specific phosphodiesterase class I)
MAYFDSLTGLYNKDMTFPIDLLKIDMDFVRGITSPSKKERAIIKSIIQLAKNLTIEVLAEGVETIEQYTYLKDNGCNKIQGYYFYKPMPANEIENLLSN